MKFTDWIGNSEDHEQISDFKEDYVRNKVVCNCVDKGVDLNETNKQSNTT